MQRLHHPVAFSSARDKVMIWPSHEGDRSVGSAVAWHETIGVLPMNVSFGPAVGRQVYVTENVSGPIEISDALADGLRLHGARANA